MKYIGGKWMIATSAGPDSMALLSMCLEAGIDCMVAHVNYHYRPQAEFEEAYIRNFCISHGIPCFIYNETFVWQGNFEAAARKWRYDFFARLVKEHHCNGVLVAHHRDDLLETYCMQKEKNIVPEVYGLAKEIVYQGVLVKRPLLDCYKSDLERYCKENSIQYFVDQSNQDITYTRNWFRHEYLSKMDCFQKEQLYLEIVEKNRQLYQLREEASSCIENHCFSLELYRTLEEEMRLTILRMTMEHIGLCRQRRAHLLEIDSILMKHNDFCFVQNEYQLVVNQDRCFWMKEVKKFFAQYETLEDVMAAEGNGIFKVCEGTLGKCAVTVTERDFPLTIRTWEPGDAIKMRFGTKMISRYLIDRHIPIYQRKMQIVVQNSAGNIILVPGLGCDVEHYSGKPNFNVILCYNS